MYDDVDGLGGLVELGVGADQIGCYVESSLYQLILDLHGFFALSWLGADLNILSDYFDQELVHGFGAGDVDVHLVQLLHVVLLDLFLKVDDLEPLNLFRSQKVLLGEGHDCVDEGVDVAVVYFYLLGEDLLGYAGVEGVIVFAEGEK